MSRLRVWRVPASTSGGGRWKIVAIPSERPAPHPRAVLLAEVLDDVAEHLLQHVRDEELRRARESESR